MFVRMHAHRHVHGWFHAVEERGMHEKMQLVCVCVCVYVRVCVCVCMYVCVCVCQITQVHAEGKTCGNVFRVCVCVCGL